ncbi:helix-turn-helix domain-containing protein [Maricaulis maris]|uniref:helix-turn-helix domain-containing protein n=1 Tax=Maricaulis maris TaxID=74318 RepID=UPI003B8E1BCE
MVIPGAAISIDPAIRWQVIQMYWRITASISEATALDPLDRLIVTAIEVADLTGETSPSIRVIAAALDRSTSTIHRRVHRLIADGFLERDGRRLVILIPGTINQIYASIAGSVRAAIQPHVALIRSIIAAPGPRPPPRNEAAPTIDGLIIDRDLKLGIALFFFNMSLAAERRTGLDPIDRLIVLEIESFRLDPSRSGGPNAQSLSRATRIPPATMSWRVQRLIAKGLVTKSLDGLATTAEATGKTYSILIEHFLEGVPSLLDLINSRVT